jgi:predicted RNase H-like nuclease (RuvC/YqgF family)
MGTNEETPSQQLKQEKLAIAELYQENRELKRQLATKTAEASAAQSRGGNVVWLKRKLKEAQNVIVQLREAQRLAEEKHMEHPGECGAAEQGVCVALASAQGEKA